MEAFCSIWPGVMLLFAPESIEGIKNKPVGTGAFTFQNWVQGDRIELSRNPIIGKSACFRKSYFNSFQIQLQHLLQLWLRILTFLLVSSS